MVRIKDPGAARDCDNGLGMVWQPWAEGVNVRHFCIFFLLLMAPLGFASPPAAPALSDDMIEGLARDIVRSCPAGNDADRNEARDECSKSLGLLSVLDQATLNGSLRWGAVKGDDFDPAHNSLTVLNALVWRKVYLSLFAFTGTHSVEVLPDESRLVRFDVRLRRLPNSEFPYPFWHSRSKWRGYQQAIQVALLFKGGKLLAGYRNAKVDTNVSARDDQWDGLWTTESGTAAPRTALFDYLLSHDNPYARRLDQAYKSMAMAARQFQCEACHNPANPASMNPLFIFNLPSQALSGRHQIVYALDHNEMPPKQGISDDGKRKRLMRFALDFERLGDEALQFETDHTATSRPAGE